MLKQSWVGEVDPGDIFEWHNNVFWWTELGYSQTLRILWKKKNGKYERDLSLKKEKKNLQILCVNVQTVRTSYEWIYEEEPVYYNPLLSKEAQNMTFKIFKNKNSFNGAWQEVARHRNV